MARQVVSFKFEPHLLERVESGAKAAGLNRSQFVFGLLERGLASQGQESLTGPPEPMGVATADAEVLDAIAPVPIDEERERLIRAKIKAGWPRDTAIESLIKRGEIDA